MLAATLSSVKTVYARNELSTPRGVVITLTEISTDFNEDRRRVLLHRILVGMEATLIEIDQLSEPEIKSESTRILEIATIAVDDLKKQLVDKSG